LGSLTGKVAIVTGASRGLGEAMAIRLGQEGASLVLAARTLADLERVAASCGDATAVRTDITVEDDVRALVERALSGHGRIDVFVANAGASYLNMTDKRYKELYTYDLDVVEQLFRLNAIGTWLCIKHALPAMKEGSSFIAIGSSTGRAAYAGAGIYAVSKATIDVMVRMASKEMEGAGVRVNCLGPGGMVDTHLFGPNKMPEHMRNLPMIRPIDVMNDAAVWLASDDSIGVTGRIIEANEFNDRGPDAVKAGSSA
jgi:NAD(P)-dependent dehydrogenase (short-subunit alcohol dehydrogenase family)